METKGYLTRRKAEYVHRDENLVSVDFYTGLMDDQSETGDYDGMMDMQCKCDVKRSRCQDNLCSNFKDLKPCPKSCQVTKCKNKGVLGFKQLSSLTIFVNKFGVGVKTTQAVPSNQVILEFVGEVITSAEYLKRQQTRTGPHSFGMETTDLRGRKFIIDPTDIGNFGRFVNSSHQPNTEILTEFVHGMPKVYLKTKREIKAGEEITYLYGGDILKDCLCQVCESKKLERLNIRNILQPKRRLVLQPKPHISKAKCPPQPPIPTSDDDSDDTLFSPAPLKKIDENLSPPKSLKTHDGRFSCAHCPKKFSRLEHRRRHMESQHLGKKHPCAKCPKSFQRKDVLTRHMQTKHGERRKKQMEKHIFCLFCEVGFVTTRNLRRHLNCVHNIDRVAF